MNADDRARAERAAYLEKHHNAGAPATSSGNDPRPPDDWEGPINIAWPLQAQWERRQPKPPIEWGVADPEMTEEELQDYMDGGWLDGKPAA